MALPAFTTGLDGPAVSQPEAGSHDRSPACTQGSVSSEVQASLPRQLDPASSITSPKPRQGHNGARRGFPMPQGWREWARAISQVLIALLGGAAILLTACDGPLRAWGFLLGLCSQPLWLVATWQARQWGMFFLSLWYCLGWGLGVWRYWL